jgi:sulfur carrier protein
MPLILINGETRELPNNLTIAEAIASLGLTGKRIAVECNGEIVPRSLHTKHYLHEGDRVEIVAAVGGG